MYFKRSLGFVLWISLYGLGPIAVGDNLSCRLRLFTFSAIHRIRSEKLGGFVHTTLEPGRKRLQTASRLLSLPQDSTPHDSTTHGSLQKLELRTRRPRGFPDVIATISQSPLRCRHQIQSSCYRFSKVSEAWDVLQGCE